MTASSLPAVLPAVRRPGPCALPQNAGDAHIQGVEAEVFARPVDGLQIDGSLSWIDFEYQCVFPSVVGVPGPNECTSDPAVVGLLGDRPPALPEWKWSWASSTTFRSRARVHPALRHVLLRIDLGRHHQRRLPAAVLHPRQCPRNLARQ
jgi:outer membrane receptor protein involved in Fe transport